MAFCAGCGEALLNTPKFCANCGVAVPDESAAVELTHNIGVTAATPVMKEKPNQRPVRIVQFKMLMVSLVTAMIFASPWALGARGSLPMFLVLTVTFSVAIRVCLGFGVMLWSLTRKSLPEFVWYLWALVLSIALVGFAIVSNGMNKTLTFLASASDSILTFTEEVFHPFQFLFAVILLWIFARWEADAIGVLVREPQSLSTKR